MSAQAQTRLSDRVRGSLHKMNPRTSFRPSAEAGLTLAAALLFGWQSAHAGPAWFAVPAVLLSVVAGVLCGIAPGWGAAATALPVAVSALWATHFPVLVLSTALIALFSLISRGRHRSAAVLTGGYLAAWLYVHVRLTDPGPLLGWILLFAVAFVIPWPIGMAFRSARADKPAQVARTLRQQRREIATELHDYVTHDLSLMVLCAEEASLKHGADPDLAFIATTARRCNANARQLMEILRAGRAPGDAATDSFDTAVEEVQRKLRSRGFDITVMADADAELLPPHVQHSLARISREMTRNVLDHGDPAHPVRILCSIDEDEVVFAMVNTPRVVSDSGTGYGVPTMAQRIESFGGTFSAGRQGDQWVTKAALPLSAASWRAGTGGAQ